MAKEHFISLMVVYTLDNGNMEKGMEKGKEEGRAEERAEVARKMLSKGLAVADVAEMTGLSPAQVQELQR